MRTLKNHALQRRLCLLIWTLVMMAQDVLMTLRLLQQDGLPATAARHRARRAGHAAHPAKPSCRSPMPVQRQRKMRLKPGQFWMTQRLAGNARHLFALPGLVAQDVKQRSNPRRHTRNLHSRNPHNLLLPQLPLLLRKTIQRKTMQTLKMQEDRWMQLSSVNVGVVKRLSNYPGLYVLAARHQQRSRMTRVARQVGQQWLMVSCQMMNRWLRLNALPLGLLLSVNNVTLRSSLNGPGVRDANIPSQSPEVKTTVCACITRGVCASILKAFSALIQPHIPAAVGFLQLKFCKSRRSEMCKGARAFGYLRLHKGSL